MLVEPEGAFHDHEAKQAMLAPSAERVDRAAGQHRRSRPQALRILGAAVFPLLLYGAEIWASGMCKTLWVISGCSAHHQEEALQDHMRNYEEKRTGGIMHPVSSLCPSLLNSPEVRNSFTS